MERFQASLEGWRERYLDRSTAELAALLTQSLLTQSDGTLTEWFWTTRTTFNGEARTLRQSLDGFT